MRPSGAAPTSPPEGVLRHMRHQELWRAVGTHYGPTRIYGPTGHAIGGTEQQALRELLPRLSQPGLGTISDDYGPAAIRRSKDLAAAAGSPRDSQESTTGRRCSWRTRTGSVAVRQDIRRPRDRRSGARRQSKSTGLGVQCKSTRRGMCRVFIILTSCSFFLGKPSHTGSGATPIRTSSAIESNLFLVTILLAKIVTGFESE
jgi:hypothetical protein